MGTTRDAIREWLIAGQKKGATHVIVVCDTFDHGDYPVYVLPDEDVRKKASNPGSMQRVMEVYSLTGKHTIEAQLTEQRAFHYD